MKGSQFWTLPDEAAKYFLTTGFPSTAKLIAEFIAIKEAIANKQIIDRGLLIDLGSGPGNASSVMAPTFGFKKCIAVDSSEPMLQIADEVYKAMDPNCIFETQKKRSFF